MPNQPAISDLSSRPRVLEAISEFDRLGREDFLARYRYGPALRHRIRYAGALYDSKAIAGVAWGLQHFDDGHRRPHLYKGGAQTTVRALEKLGFEIVTDELPREAPKLSEGETYSWEELGGLFDFEPQYLASAGGMVSRPQLNSLILITHSQEGRSFSYGDAWEGRDMIYAGRGLTGDQELKGQNKQVAENSRELFLFEHAGRRELLFHSQVRCVEWWESTGFDKQGEERRVFRFRLRPLDGRSASRRTKRPSQASPLPGGARSSYKPRPFDPDRKPSERSRSAPRDPESQKVLSEQADAAHQATLRAFGLWLRAERWSRLEEFDGAIDLRARSGQRRALFEIKSIRPGTERPRVRSGLAQLLEYRLFLGAPRDELCLVSNRPISERRLRLLDSLSIGHAYVQDGEVKVSGTQASRALFAAREPNAR